MSKPFNPFDPAIKALQKSIDSKRAALTRIQQDADWYFDLEKRKKTFFDLGRYEMTLEIEMETATGARKKQLQADLDKTRKSVKRYQNIDPIKDMDKEDALNREIEELQLALRQVQRLQSSHHTSLFK